VFLAYAVPAKATRVLIDRELYVPRSWTGVRDLVRGDGHPRCTVFATKPQLAQKMIERAIAGALPFSWFTADEAYGDNGPLRDWLEQAKVAYVVAVSCDHHNRRGRPDDPRRQARREGPGPRLAATVLRAGPTSLSAAAVLGSHVAAEEDCCRRRDGHDNVDRAEEQPAPVFTPSAPPDATARIDAPGSQCWVLGTMRTMMFSTARSQAKPMMTANTADRTNWPSAIPSTL
jgi:hypothetical protein